MPHSDGIDHAKEEKEVIEVESKPSSLLEEIETEHQPTAEDIHDEITNSQEISAAADNSLTINDFMYCKYCGKKIEADSSYCKYCGRKL